MSFWFLESFLLGIPAFILVLPFYVNVFQIGASGGSGVPANPSNTWRVHVNCDGVDPTVYSNHTPGLYQLDQYHIFDKSPQRFGFCDKFSSRKGSYDGDSYTYTNLKCINVGSIPSARGSIDTWTLMDEENMKRGFNSTLRADADTWNQYIYPTHGHKASYGGAFTSYVVIYSLLTWPLTVAAFPYGVIPAAVINWVLTIVSLPIYYTWLPILSKTSQMDPLAWSTWYFEGCSGKYYKLYTRLMSYICK